MSNSEEKANSSHRSAITIVFAILVLAVATVVGCGGDDESSSVGSTSGSGTSAASADSAEAVLEKARAPLAEFDGPTAAPEGVPEGKEIAVIKPLSAPLPDRAAQGVVDAADSVGWDTRVIDGQGTPEGYVNALDQAISAQVDGIILVAMPVPLLSEQIKKAEAEGIPVVAALASLPTGDEDPEEFGAYDFVNADYDEQGKILANWVIADAPEGAKAIRLTSSEFPDLTRESDVFGETLEAAGNYEVVDEIESPVTDILGGPQGVQRLAAAMRANPDVNYFFILSESWSQIFMQAKKLTGREDVVGLGSDGDVTVPLVANGEELVMIGPDSLTYGWYSVDAMIRAFNGEEPVHYDLRSQLVDATNAGEVDGDGITATYDYAAAWQELWGGN
jgi:ribose transport system substrate-binding protein